MYHCFYSETSASIYGSVWYLTKNGMFILTTAVYRSKEEGEEKYLWKDRIYTGVAEKYHSRASDGWDLGSKIDKMFDNDHLG